MKEYRISELMENYTDNEFFVEGEQTVDTEKAVSELLGQVRPKKRMKPIFKMLIAAAAAAALFAGATIASSSIIGKGHFTTALNARVEYDSWDGREGEYYTHSQLFSYETTDLIYPTEERDGRLYFTADEQNVDITDLIDRKTPYIYTYTIPQTGFPVHIIVGGDPDELSYVELIGVEGFSWQGIGYSLDGEKHVDISVTFKHYDGSDGYTNSPWGKIFYDRWTDLNGDGEKQDDEIFEHEHDDIYDIPASWEEDCPDAWLISALKQLDFI